jgi:hypothetical protein
LLYFVQFQVFSSYAYRDKVVGVFVRFRALQLMHTAACTQP